MSDLGSAQRRFSLMLAQFVAWVYTETGREVTLGEAYRSDEQAEINSMGQQGRAALCTFIAPRYPALAAKIANNVGSGIASSLHCERLAQDLNLFLYGAYQSGADAYLPLGEKWESMGGTWGGRFGDPNHFSLAFGGLK